MWFLRVGLQVGETSSWFQNKREVDHMQMTKQMLMTVQSVQSLAVLKNRMVAYLQNWSMPG